MIEYNKLYELTKDLKILYVEDDIAFQKESYEMFNYFFIDIDLANNGEDALAKYLQFYKENNSYYDIVITDISMPKMNGLDMCREIRKVNNNIPIIITTAHNDKDFLHKAIDVGISKFVTKPIDMHQLIDNIKRV